MEAKFCITHKDEYGTRTFFCNAQGRGLFQELPAGERQIVGTCDVSFASEEALRAYVEHRFGDDDDA